MKSNKARATNQPTDSRGITCEQKVGLKVRLLLGCFAIGYAILMLALGGVTGTRLYGPSPYHRQQASAILSGHFYLGDSIYQIEQNSAWHGGKIQQVWGLGVGLWLTPFELCYRALGQQDFPDRIAMGVAFALLAAYVGATGLRLARLYRKPIFGIGLTALVLCNPTLLNLNGSRHLVYEDTVLYACLVSFGILTAVVRVACFSSRNDFLICCVLAAASGLVRPTHGLYGLLGVTICVAVLAMRKWPLKSLIAGMVIFFAGLVFLAGTNWLRFGSPLGFGHKLTATGGAMVYFTRFGNPFREATILQAGKELFGALFLPKGHIQLNSAEDTAAGQMFRASSIKDAVVFQAPVPRWRDMYMPTFDLSTAALVLIGMCGTILWLVGRGYSQSDTGATPAPANTTGSTTTQTGCRRDACATRWRPADKAVFGGLLIWAVAGVIGLGCFYLFFPILCARYLLDFGPAFAGALILVWLGASARFPKIALALLAVWLCWEILPERGGAPSHYLLTKEELPQAAKVAKGRSLAEYSGRYTIEQHPYETRIAFNSEGWSPDDGTASPVIVLAVDRPEFVELQVEPRFSYGVNSPEDNYRARLGSTELNLDGVTEESDLLTVRFSIPEEIIQQGGDHLLFLCFIESCDEADRDSQRILHSVRWH